MNLNFIIINNKMLTNDEIQSIYDMYVELYHDLKSLVMIILSLTM